MVKMVARQIFDKAVYNHIISCNPLPKRMKDIVQFANDTTILKAMTEDEQSRYLEYIYNINHCYKELIGFLLLTGLRIVEAVALD